MTDILSKKETSILLAKEEKLLNWNEVLDKLKIFFGNDIYESWIKNVNLKKEFNHYVILSVPTRFVRDWIVSRYADKILDVIKIFKKSIQRLEFLIEETQEQSNQFSFSKQNKVTSIENSLLNYNRFSPNNRFDNFMPKFHSQLMKIVKTGTIKKRTASRKISRVAKKIKNSKK